MGEQKLSVKSITIFKAEYISPLKINNAHCITFYLEFLIPYDISFEYVFTTSLPEACTLIIKT